jgi:hypothetical protein
MTAGNTGQEYSQLLHKLREFKRKFYLNRMLRGAIWFVAVGLVSYLLVTILEYFGRFDPTARTILFYSFIAVNAFLLARFIVLPLLSLLELRKNLSYEQAATIIGEHFSEVKDKLLNTLQMHSMATAAPDPFERSLLEAGIEQKIRELRPVPFVKAVDYSRNRKYIKYAAIPLLVLLVLLFQAPQMILESTQRLVDHNQYFKVPAPFEFVLGNDSLTAIRNEDFTVHLKIKGKELPAEVFIEADGKPFLMTPESKTQWAYTFHNIQSSAAIRFNASGFSSDGYELKVLPRPMLEKFELTLHYPAYLGKKTEKLQNAGDITIPEGTTVDWKFYTGQTDQITLRFADGNKIAAKSVGEDEFTWTRRFLHDATYILNTSNKYIRNNDSIQYQVNVIPDAFPDINANAEQDSIHTRTMLFSGNISDDYGLRRLNFNYRYTRSADSAKMKQSTKSVHIPVAAGRLAQPFYYYWDFSNVSIEPGDELEYYFEVWDNDGVNGSKSSRTQKFFFKAPSLDELYEQTSANNDEMKDRLNSAIKNARKLQKDYQDARMKLLNKKDFNWQDQKMVEDLLKKQQDLQDQVKDAEQQFQKNLQQQKDYKTISEETLEKHEELQDLMKQVLDEKTLKQLEELKKMLEQQNKEGIQKQLDQMKYNDKEVQKELDRMLELFKQMEFQQKLEQTVEQLDKLKEDQQKLAEEADKTKDPQKLDELKKQQEELQKKFDDLKKSLDELEKKNEELENKNDMENTSQQEKSIESNMQQGQEQLQQKQGKKAAQQMKKASDQMQQLSDKLKKMQQDMQSEQNAEDYQSLRQILENLIYVSKEQEKVMGDFSSLTQYSPKFIELSKRQQELKEDARLIEDSLTSLSKRAIQIKSYVNKEIGEINFNMDKTLEALSARDVGNARTSQQFTMMHLNNLALMLSEAMQQMQQQMQQQQKSGQGSCKNPKPGQKNGQGKMSMEQLRKMQEQLNQEMQGLKEGLQKGQNPANVNKQLAEMAAQQEMLRQQLEKMAQEMSKEAQKTGDMKQMQDMMDKTKEDLYNKRITDETIKRQKDIEVRMLQTEKAMKKQDFDDQRESKTADQKGKPSSPLLEKYLRAKEQEVELLRTVPPTLSPYYRDKVKQYFETK